MLQCLVAMNSGVHINGNVVFEEQIDEYNQMAVQSTKYYQIFILASVSSQLGGSSELRTAYSGLASR